ncbi:MAG: DUF4097 family beta strand repeat-containing protein [bacterium]
MRIAIALGTIVLLGASVAYADRPVDQTAKVNKDGTVSVSNIAGSVTVVGGNRSDVHITGRLDDNVEELRVEERDGDLRIEVILPRRSHRGGDADLKLEVPKGVALDIETVSANIEVEGVAGDVDLESVSGGVRVEGGDGVADVQSVSGDIELTGAFENVDAESVSGGIDVKGASGRIDASTTSGRIEVAGGDFDSVDLESMSGRVEFAGDPRKDADISIESFSGRVVLTLPASLSAEIDVETHSGSIESDFGSGVRKEKYGAGAWLETSVGGGEASIEVSTFSGSVSLRKK